MLVAEYDDLAVPKIIDFGVAKACQHRHSEPKELSTLIRGELDWIVMKAMEKDRTRRYETANGLASDIRRYLDDEPITVRPASAAYRFHKFARRNRGILATVAAIGMILCVALLISTWAAIRATHAENLANQHLVAEQHAHQQARAAEQETKQQLFNAYNAQAKASR